MFIGGGVYAANESDLSPDITINSANFNVVLNAACGADQSPVFTGRKWFRNETSVNGDTSDFPKTNPIPGCTANAQDPTEKLAVDKFDGKTRAIVANDVLPVAPLFFENSEADYDGATGMPLVTTALDTDLCKYPATGPAASCEKRVTGLNLEPAAEPAGSFKPTADGYAVIDSAKLLAFKTGNYNSVGWTTTAAGTQPAVAGGSEVEKTVINSLNGLSGAQAQDVCQNTYNLSPTAATGFPLAAAAVGASECTDCTRTAYINSAKLKEGLLKALGSNAANRKWVSCAEGKAKACGCDEPGPLVGPGATEDSIFEALNGLEMNSSGESPAECYIKSTFANNANAASEGVIQQSDAIAVLRATNTVAYTGSLSGTKKEGGGGSPSSAALVSLPIAALLAMPLMW